MNKEEASKISIEKTKVIIETIEAILTDSISVEAFMEFGSAKKEKQYLCTLDIAVPKKNYFRYWFMGVPTNYSPIFYKQVLSAILDNFGGLEKVSLSDFCTGKINGKKFSGVILENSIGTKISLNFKKKSKDFEDLITFFKESKQKKENARESK